MKEKFYNNSHHFVRTILSLALELENKWYEEKFQLFILNAKYDPRDLKDLADDYIQCHPIENHHIEWGLI